jgi:hypothetical protein
MRVYVSPSADFTVGVHERDIATDSLSRFNDVYGEQSASVKFTAEVVGSGTQTTEPEIDTFLQSCGMAKTTLKKIAIGAITGGPYEHGETITGGTSGATGRVVVPAANGDAEIHFETISGTFVAETITGGTSSASCTSSAGESTGGFSYQPSSSNQLTYSVQLEEDGVTKRFLGCNGTFKISGEMGKPLLIEGELMGAVQGVVDASMTSGIDYYSTVPPVLLSAGMKINADAGDALSPIIQSVSVDIANKLTMRPDANKSNGFVSARISGRRPVGSIDPEMVLVATHDFFGKWFAGTNIQLEFKAGSSDGNTFWFFGENAQYDGISDADRDGIATNGVDMKFQRVDEDTGDDEIELVFI